MMKEIQAPHKIILRARIKKCGGSAWSVVTTGRYLLTVDFAEVGGLLAFVGNGEVGVVEFAE